MGVVGAGSQIAGQILGGKAQKRAAYAEAQQMELQAKQEEAVGSYKANVISQRAKELLATQRAKLASSGGGAGPDDPTAAALASETAKRATFETLLELAQSKDSANQIRFGATQRRRQGRQAFTRGILGGIDTAVKFGEDAARVFVTGGAG